jgi:hypothetical protein
MVRRRWARNGLRPTRPIARPATSARLPCQGGRRGGAHRNPGAVTPADLDVPALIALVEMPLDSWDAAAYPLCRDGVPNNTDVGKGRQFLASRG